MPYRDHQPIVIDQFNGLWKLGDADECPLDHFQDCENIKFIGSKGFGTRDGIGIHQNVSSPLANIVRIFNYITQDENTLIVLVEGGDVYHVLSNGITVFGPILSIAGMTDIAVQSYAGRAYITPVATYGTGANAIEKGMEDEFLYVYLGDGVAARKAAGSPPVNEMGDTFAASVSATAGLTDAGFHLFAVVYETDTGFLTAPGPIGAFSGINTLANFAIDFDDIPVSPDSFVIARRLVATKIITNYNGDETGYQFFFIPEGRIDNNTATTFQVLQLFDTDLVEDASHLIDNYAEIPAGCSLSLYHTRLCLSTTFEDISIVLVSASGEPEAISQIDGLIIAPLDGNPITCSAELRDIFYVFKKARTLSYVDNGDVPSSWPLTIVDYGVGCPLHGIATVVDSGAASTDYLIIASYVGIILFNGRYLEPELTWKIRDFWLGQDKLEFRRVQIVNDTVNNLIMCCLPDTRLLVGNYSNGQDAKKIRWTPVRADIQFTTIALVNISDVIIGSIRRYGAP